MNNETLEIIDMTIKQKADLNRGIELDLTGLDGNAYSLLAYTAQFGKQLGYSNEQLQALHTDMTSSDYAHLVKTFNNEFGKYVTLLVDDEEE